MPIWSLTQERVEKLLKQIGDKEIEIDTLIKLTPQDIWKRDLDDFINEWRFQLEDEAKRQKKVANMGRRASNKLRIGASGPTGRKRKAKDGGSDDSDFGGAAPAKKAAPAKRVVDKKVPKTNLLSDLKPVSQPKAAARPTKTAPKAASKKAGAQPKIDTKDIWMNVDGDSGDVAMAPIFKKVKAAAPAISLPGDGPKHEDEDSADEEIIRPATARPGRRAATKPAAYTLDDSDDSNGDGVIFDVGKMVKGIGNAPQVSTSNARHLFSASTSRPGSSAGLPKKSTTSGRQPIDLEAEDDTDYAMVAPVPTDKKAVTARETVISDDSMDDEDPFIAPAPKKAPAAAKPSKPTPKKAAAPAAKKATQSKILAEPKKMPLSPAAKAYAAKQQKARAQRVVQDDSDDEEVEKVVNELLDEDDEMDDEPVVGRRPARRAAVAAVGKTRNVVESDGDEDGVSEVDEVTSGFEEEGSSFE